MYARHSRLFGGDIGLGWPWFDNGCSGAVENGDRPINGVALIGQFSTFLFEQASYLIRVNHCHSRGFAVMGMCCDWTWCSVQRVAGHDATSPASSVPFISDRHDSRAWVSRPLQTPQISKS